MAQSHGTDRRKMPNFKKIGILIGFIVEAVNEVFFNMSEEQLQYWILKKDAIRNQVRSIFKVTENLAGERDQWRKFYHKYFSLELNFTNLIIPEKPAEGLWRLLIIAEGLTLNQVCNKMASMFKCWKYVDDLDKDIPTNIRDTKTAYAVWVRDEVEPDEKYLGKSTEQADPDMTIGVTVLERMIHEMMYFNETGKHLDIKGVTFCMGSRGSGGDVPCMYFSNGEVQVDWYDLDYSHALYGLREAVSK